MTDVTVWDGSTDDNWNDADNWSNGVPSTSKIASIPGSLSTYPDLASDCTVHALLISSGATLTGGTNITVFVTGKSAGETNAPTNLYAVEINGTISGELNFNITTPSATKLDLNGSSGNINDLTINHSSCVATIQTTTTLDGDLNITAGEFNTHSLGQQLTVKGNTVVSGTLTGNNSTLIFGESGVHGSTEAGALHVESGGSLTFGSGDLTAFSGFTAKGTNTVTSTGGGDILIKGRTNNGFMNSHGHTGVNITGDYKIDFDTDALHDIRGDMAITAANITYLHGGRTYSFWTTATTNTVTFTGNLNVSGSSAELNTLASGQEAADAFTVTGDAILTGDLIANDTTINLGSLTIGSNGEYSATSGTTTIKGNASSSANLAWANSGTFTHNSGTVLFDGTNTFGGSSFGHINPATNTFNNLTINADSKVLQLRGNSTTLTVAGDLTMTDGTLMNYGTDTVTTTVTGDVSIANGATIGANTGGNDMTAPLNFKSLTIASGGTFIATSDTTTITGEASSGFNLSNSGTFTHNKGTVKVTCATQTTLTGFSGSNAFFNFTYAGTGSGQDQICGANTDFFGQVVIDSANSEVQMQQHTFNLYDGIRIKQGGWDIGSSSTSGTINVYGAVRNVGGTVVASQYGRNN